MPLTTEQARDIARTAIGGAIRDMPSYQIQDLLAEPLDDDELAIVEAQVSAATVHISWDDQEDDLTAVEVAISDAATATGMLASPYPAEDITAGLDAGSRMLGEVRRLRRLLHAADREKDRIRELLLTSTRERDNAREQLAHAEETKHDLLPLPALEISAQEIRARALQLAAEHFGGDVYECADELAAYITTGQHPGKDHTDE